MHRGPCNSDVQKGRKPRPLLRHGVQRAAKSVTVGGDRLAPTPGVAISLKVEQLWAFADGTICLIVEREEEPRFEVCVMRGERVLHQERLSFRAAAHLRSQTWRTALQPAPQVTH